MQGHHSKEQNAAKQKSFTKANMKGDFVIINLEDLESVSVEKSEGTITMSAADSAGPITSDLSRFNLQKSSASVTILQSSGTNMNLPSKPSASALNNSFPSPPQPKQHTLVLKGNPPGVPLYITHFDINQTEQSRDLCKTVLKLLCVPCCFVSGKGKAQIAARALRAGLSSELLLYLLHLVVMALGTCKEGFRLTESDPTANIVTSSFEVFLTVLVIVIRMTKSIGGYREVKRTISVIKQSPISDVTVTSNHHVISMKKIVTLFMIACLVLIVICVTSFVFIFFFTSLAWTIMTTNFCLIAVTLMSDLYLARVTLGVGRSRQDAFRTVLFEGVHLLKDRIVLGRCTTAGTLEGVGGERLEGVGSERHCRYIGAMREGSLTALPSYITKQD